MDKLSSEDNVEKKKDNQVVNLSNEEVETIGGGGNISSIPSEADALAARLGGIK